MRIFAKFKVTGASGSQITLTAQPGNTRENSWTSGSPSGTITLNNPNADARTFFTLNKVVGFVISEQPA